MRFSVAPKRKIGRCRRKICEPLFLRAGGARKIFRPDFHFGPIPPLKKFGDDVCKPGDEKNYSRGQKLVICSMGTFISKSYIKSRLNYDKGACTNYVDKFLGKCDPPM